jgi:hypothetical protein
MKSNLPARRFRRRSKKRKQFLVNVSQSGIVFQEVLIDFGEAPQNCRIRRQFFPLLDKRPNHPFGFAQGRLRRSSRSPDRFGGYSPPEARRAQ